MLAPATPKANAYRTTKHVSQREKEKIVQLFDIELESRLNDLKTHLEAKLNNLMMYSNNQITRLPPSVRMVTLREFGEKYGGEIHALVRGMASMNVLRNNPVPPSVGKRKRDEGVDDQDDLDSRKIKAARQASASPRKPARTASGARSHATAATFSSMRQTIPKPPPFPSSTSHPSNMIQHHTSMSQLSSTHVPTPQTSNFPHSSDTFDPKTNRPLPVYPRQMRPDEVILSENGSPVANPFSRSGGMHFSREMKDVERELAISRIAVARDSSSTSRTRSSQITAVNGSDRSSSGTAVFGSGLMLQVKTASGNLVAFDPLQTMPEDLEARGDLPKDDKKAIASAMLQFASTMKSWGNLASS